MFRHFDIIAFAKFFLKDLAKANSIIA